MLCILQENLGLENAFREEVKVCIEMHSTNRFEKCILDLECKWLLS